MRKLLRLGGMVAATAVAAMIALVAGLGGPPASAVRIPPSVVVDRSVAHPAPSVATAGGSNQEHPAHPTPDPAATKPGPRDSPNPASTSSPTPEGSDPATPDNAPQPTPNADA